MNKLQTLAILACLLGSLAIFPQAQAQTYYVSDVIYVPMRSGAGNQFRIVHQGIRSGTPLTVLGDSGSEDWMHVRTSGGIEGYIRSQYVSRTPTARMQLNEAQTQLAQAEKRADTLEEQLTALRSEHQALTATAEQQAQQRDRFEQELGELKVLSADAVNLNKRYQELLAKNEMMQTERDALRAENDRLQSDQMINQWLFGAGLLVAGMVLMLILPALKPKKGHSDWAN